MPKVGGLLDNLEDVHKLVHDYITEVAEAERPMQDINQMLISPEEYKDLKRAIL